MDDVERRTLIIYFVFSWIATALNAYIVFLILSKIINAKIPTPFILLHLAFHISNIGDIVTALPDTFNFNDNWCLANEAFKFYFGLMNIVIIFYMIQANRALLFSKNSAIVTTSMTQNIAIFAIFIFPLIAFLPFTDNAFDLPATDWCVLTYDRSAAWALMVQYVWVFLILFVNIITNIYMLSFFRRHGSDRAMIRQYLLNVCSYSIIAAISWVPRFYELWEPKRDDDDNTIILKFYQFFPISIAGILYVMLFLWNRQALLYFASQNHRNTDDIMHFPTNDLLSIVEEGAKDDHSRSNHSSLSNTSFVQLFSEYFRISSRSFLGESETSHRHSTASVAKDIGERHTGPESRPGSELESNRDSNKESGHNSEKKRTKSKSTTQIPGRQSLMRQSFAGGSSSGTGGTGSGGGGAGSSAYRRSSMFSFMGTNSSSVGLKISHGSDGRASEGGGNHLGRPSLFEYIQELRRERQQQQQQQPPPATTNNSNSNTIANSNKTASEGITMNPIQSTAATTTASATLAESKITSNEAENSEGHSKTEIDEENTK